jgi:hypothetical protein
MTMTIATVLCVLALLALITTVVAMMGRCPLTVPVFLLAFIELVRCLPTQ